MLKVDVYKVNKMDDSKKYNLNKGDFLKIAKGLGIGILGYLLVAVVEILPQIEFGEYAIFAQILGAVLANAALKFNKGN